MLIATLLNNQQFGIYLKYLLILGNLGVYIVIDLFVNSYNHTLM